MPTQYIETEATKRAFVLHCNLLNFSFTCTAYICIQEAEATKRVSVLGIDYYYLQLLWSMSLSR